MYAYPLHCLLAKYLITQKRSRKAKLTYHLLFLPIRGLNGVKWDLGFALNDTQGIGFFALGLGF